MILSGGYKCGFWLLFWGGFIFRLLYIASDITELAPDESYYWQWSRNLDWAYYSKGPLVAWLIRAGTMIGGHTEFGIRLPTVLLSAYTLWLSSVLYRRLFPGDDRGLFLLAIFYNTVPLVMVGSLIATIDPSLCAAWLTCVWGLYLAVREQRSWAWWLVGLIFGVGILAKYTMLLFPFTLFAYLLFSPSHRIWLKRPHPYLATLGGLLFLIPILIWNVQHDWATVSHNLSLGRFSQSPSLIKILSHYVELILAQAAVASPLLFIVLVWGLVVHLRRAWREEENHAPLLIVCSCMPVIFFYFLITIKRVIIPNWLALMYPFAILAAAQVWSQRLRQSKGVWLFWLGAALGAMMCFLVIFSETLYILHLPNAHRWDPAARLKGWSSFAQLALENAQTMPEDVPLFYLGKRYQTASELAFYLPDQPKTYCIFYDPPENQYNLWKGSENLIGHNAIFMMCMKDQERMILPPQVENAFERIERGSANVEARNGFSVRYQQAWRCYSFKGWSTPEE